MLDPLLLRTFITVVDEGGFTRAATRLHLTQSAISGHIQRLESQIGKKLLDRNTRSFELTAEGHQLIGYARAILSLTREAIDQFSPEVLRGEIRVAIAEDFAHAPLLNLFKEFSHQHPKVMLNVHVEIHGLMDGALNLGDSDVVLNAQCGTGIGNILWAEPLVWAWHEQNRPLPTPLPLALFPEPCPYRNIALAQLAKAGIAHHIVMRCASMASLRAAAQSGFAIAPMPQSQLGKGLIALKQDILPTLPNAEFRLYTKRAQGENPLVDALTIKILDHSEILRM